MNSTVITVYFTDSTGELVTSVSATIDNHQAFPTSSPKVVTLVGYRHQVVVPGCIDSEILIETLYPNFIETKPKNTAGLILIDKHEITEKEAERKSLGDVSHEQDRKRLITQAEQDEYILKLSEGLNWYIANSQNLPRPLMSFERYSEELRLIDRLLKDEPSKDKKPMIEDLVKAFFETSDNVVQEFLEKWEVDQLSGHTDRETADYVSLVLKCNDLKKSYDEGSFVPDDIVRSIWVSFSGLKNRKSGNGITTLRSVQL